jgi:hypothetical protein
VRNTHMRSRTSFVLAAVATLVAGALQSAEIDPRLAPLQPLVGKTWRGELSPPGAARPMVDVQRFELALNDGEYGGETLFVWDDGRRASSIPISPPRGSTPRVRCSRKATPSSPTRSCGAPRAASAR